MDITDDLINKIHGEVGRYLARSSSRPAVDFEPGNPDHFEKAVEHLAKVLALLLKALGSSGIIFLRLVAAMCLLGPREKPPPRTMCLQLLGILRRYVPDDEQQKVRLMEFVIAFGCGKWRRVDRIAQGWDGVWQGGVRALARAMRSPVKECRLWLSGMFGLGLFPDREHEDRKQRDESEAAVLSDATVLALRLIRPEECYELGPGSRIIIAYGEEEITADCETHEEITAECRATVKILPDPKIRSAPRHESREIRPGGKCVVEIRDAEFTLELPGERVAFPGGTRFIIGVHDERTLVDCISYEDLLETDSPATVAETEHRLREKGVPIPGGSKVILKREGDKVRTQVRRTATLRKGETAAVSCGPGRTTAAFRECTCGNVHCRERHGLERWDPGFVSLWAFAAGAVKGPIPKRTGKRGQSPEQEAGRRPIQIGTLMQGMYFPLITQDGLACGGYGKRLEIVRLRLAPLCHTECSCGNTYVGPRCGRCDPELARPTRRFVKERLITVPPRLPLARLPFLKCNDCKSVTELSRDDLVKETQCQSCGKQVIREARVAEIRQDAQAGGKSMLWELKALESERKELVKQGAKCPYCGEVLEELPWKCSFCGSSSMSQKVTHAWTFDPRSWRVGDSSRGHRVDEDEVGTDEDTQSDGELNFNDE